MNRVQHGFMAALSVSESSKRDSFGRLAHEQLSSDIATKTYAIGERGF